MKNLNSILSFGLLAGLAVALGSCGISNKSLSQFDDMYYSPSAAKKQAAIDEKNRQKELEERQKLGIYSSQDGTSLQGSSNYTENNYGDNTVINNYYGTDSRMDYGGYFNRFGAGYYGYPRSSMAINPMLMYSPYSGFGTGISASYGVGNWRFGMSYGSSPFMGSYYDPFWGMGTSMYNPFMYNPYAMYNPYYMGGFGSNYYDMGYMNGYMMGSYMGGGGSYWNSGGSTVSARQPIIKKRETYGTNQRPSSGVRSNNSSTVPQSPTTRGSSTTTPTNNRTNQRTTTTPARSATPAPARTTTPSRTTTPTRTPSSGYNSGSSSGSRGSSSSSSRSSGSSNSRGGGRR